MSALIPVLLAGGEGKRLSPLSTGNNPKQFLKLAANSDDSLLQSAARRACMVSSADHVITVSSANYSAKTFDHLEKINPDLTKHIILEPSGKNTAAAIAFAATHAARCFDDPVLWIIPSDHIVHDAEKLRDAIFHSKPLASEGEIVLFGIKPTREDANYGYIIADKEIKNGLFEVASFHEKPDGNHLRWLMRQNNCWWNSGMFLLSAQTIFSSFKKHEPGLLKNINSAYNNAKDEFYGKFISESDYHNIKPLSFDKLIIEKCRNLAVNPVDIGWSDIGSWHSLWELSQEDGGDTPLENFLKKISHAA